MLIQNSRARAVNPGRSGVYLDSFFSDLFGREKSDFSKVYSLVIEKTNKQRKETPTKACRWIVY